MFDLLNYFLTYFVVFIPVIFLLLVLYRLRLEILNSKLIVLIYLGFTVILLHKLLFFDQTLSAQDFNNIQIPFFKNLESSLENYKMVPIWDNSFGGGYDVFSNPLAFYFSTFAFLFYFISDTYFAANLYITAQIFLLGIFSFLFLKELGFRKYSAFFGSLLLTFNGFVLMRLSPGVGIEYLFTYKWLPAVLLFSYTYFFKNVKKDFIFLTISLAFLFEGNPNIAFASFLIWFIFILVLCGLKKLDIYINIFKLTLSAILLYAVKLVPGIFLMLTTEGRISEVVGGWRTTRVALERILGYFLPIKDTYLPGPFTPGLVGFIFFILGLLLVIFISIKHKKLERKNLFAFISIIIGLVLTSANQVSDIIFALPIFNRITINPSFYIFLIIPLGILASEFWDFVLSIFRKYEKVIILLILGISAISFFEILKGPSLFGNSSYSFNFDKMKISEFESYDLYSVLKNKTEGNFVFLEGNKVFNLPNVTKFYELKDINKHNYFYGSSFQNEQQLENKLSFYKLHANYIISIYDIKDEDLELVETVSMVSYLDGNQNYAILINKSFFDNLITTDGWDQNLRIYRVKDTIENKSVSLASNHPYSYSYLLNEKNIEEGKALTSISYSPHWKINTQDGTKLNFSKDQNGLLVIENVKPYETVYFTYVNIYIYIGLLLSTITFIAIAYIFYKDEIKKLKD
jgi:hypothetical protein